MIKEDALTGKLVFTSHTEGILAGGHRGRISHYVTAI